MWGICGSLQQKSICPSVKMFVVVLLRALLVVEVDAISKCVSKLLCSLVKVDNKLVEQLRARWAASVDAAAFI